jgi:putative ABC transport system substrate-binding protein
MRRREFSTLLGGIATASTVWPSRLSAQQKAIPVIGFLNAGSPDTPVAYLAAFRRGLSETGFVEGQNLSIEYRWAEGRYDRLPALAADLVGRKVDVIATSAGPLPARAAKEATSTIPIVFNGGDDPVADGLVASVARPGGNITGVTLLAAELNPKRLQLVRELVPQAGLIALLVNPHNANVERVIRGVQEPAAATGVQILILKAGSDGEINAAFASLVQRQAGALLIATDVFLNSRRDQLVALAARHAVPAIYPFRGFVTAGGLISYAISVTEVHRLAGVYAGRILKGAKPADLPVVQPTIFELFINLRTAKALGLTVPPSILARADRVIE